MMCVGVVITTDLPPVNGKWMNEIGDIHAQGTADEVEAVNENTTWTSTRLERK